MDFQTRGLVLFKSKQMIYAMGNDMGSHKYNLENGTWNLVSKSQPTIEDFCF